MVSFQDRVRQGETLIGTHVSTIDPTVTEIFGDEGYDYLWIDTEHSTLDLNSVQNHLIAARATGTPAIVRIPSNDPVRVKPILEMGPAGVVFPMIRSYEEAQKAIAACYYPPKGIRSYGPRRAVQYGRMLFSDYIESVDRNLLKILQIEHIDAVRDLERILSIPEIDAFVIGPCDLTASMGKLNQMEDPEVKQALESTIGRIRAAGKTAGLSVTPSNVQQLQRWKDWGINMISMGSDVRYLLDGSIRNYQLLRQIFKKE